MLRLLTLMLWLCCAAPVLAQFSLTKGVTSEELSTGFAASPDRLSYRIVSRNLPAPMQVVFDIKERSNGFTLTGQGVLDADAEESALLFSILQRQMGDRVSLVGGKLAFRMSSRLDEFRRAKEVAIFGVPRWFQPNDCFAVVGACQSFQEGENSLGRTLDVRTSEANGIWRARATVKGTGALAYSAYYTVDASGFLIDENRTEIINGRRVRTTVRRITVSND